MPEIWQIPDVNDPRGVPSPFLQGVDIAGRSLPCGKEECVIFGEDCRLPEGDPTDGRQRRLGLLGCASQMALEVQTESLEGAEKDVEEYLNLIEKLSIDGIAGVLTLQGQKVLFERLISSGVMERLRAKGYAFQFLFADIDLLKQHNNLGAHEGGNVAIRTTAEIMREQFKRRTDSIGVLDYEREAQELEEASPGSQLDVVSRFAAGDEVIVVSLVPPPQPNSRRNVRRSPYSYVGQQVDKITKAFKNTSIEYPLNPDIALNDIARISEAATAEGLKHTIIKLEGVLTVRASLSLMFAVVVTELPKSETIFNEIKDAANKAMLALKRGRQTVATAGTGTVSLDASFEQ